MGMRDVDSGKASAPASGIQKSAEPEAFQAFERAGWDAGIEGYERHLAPVTLQAAEALLDAAGVGSDMRVLDVCTGTGILSAATAARGARAVGLDFSAAVVALARRRVPQAAFLEGDAQALPFADESFDAVVCGYGIIHCPDPEKALAEMARVLRPGGRAAISVWAAPAPDNGFGLFLGALKAHGRLDVELPHGPDFFQFSAPDRLEASLRAAGLTETGFRSVPQTWHLARPQEMVPAFREGTVRTQALFAAQTERAQVAITKAVEEALARFRARPGGYEVPMPALVGWGSR